MSGSTSVPLPTFGPNGFVAPEPAAVLQGLLADMDAAMGGGLNTALETPQGQLCSSLAAIIADAMAQFCLLANSVDPAYAAGRMQDAIGRIYFIERIAGQPTVVSATCGGQVGATIPTGALARAQDGRIYACLADVTITSAGTVDASFACQELGPIACPAGTLTELYQAVPGWDSITNLSAGVPGRLEETRDEFEHRRALSVANNASGSLGSILGALLSVSGVTDAYVTDNTTNAPVVLDGVTVPAHSLYACVVGGTNADVGRAIWGKKPPGCGTSGGTTVTVEDTNNGYVVPYPSYSISFQRAVTQTFYVLVRIKSTTQVPSDAAASIAAAVLLAFTGADGDARARIGSTVFASRFYPGVASLGSWASILSLKIGSSVAPTCVFTASLAGTTLTVTAVSSGTLAVGQFVLGTNVPDGLLITALGTGVGGTGTYTVNLPQTLASQAMQSVRPALDVVEVGVAHAPTLVLGNVLTELV